MTNNDTAPIATCHATRSRGGAACVRAKNHEGRHHDGVKSWAATAAPLVAAVPGELNAWHMLGYLSSRLENKGRITKADWNEAAASSIEAYRRSPERW